MRRLLTIILTISLSLSAFAKLSVKYPCSDGMVLQQQCEALVWGHASPGAKINVKTSWDNKIYHSLTDEKGVWRVNVSTPKASYTNYQIEVRGDADKMVIKDVLIGEVWLASGQSNMEMPIRGFFNCPVEGAAEVIATPAMPDKIRMFTVEITPTLEPQDDVQKTHGWRKASPQTVSEMSATAYFYAKRLQSVLDVPVGIVNFPRGGARVESWLPREVLEAYGTEDCSPEGVMKRRDWERAYMMYNGMQHPIQGYTAKGFIWYQGCSNVGADEVFVERMSKLISLWREDWGDTEAKMPFYMVEIAPFAYQGGQMGRSAALRAAQLQVSREVANCELVCTNDLVATYEFDNIHPCKKKEVGDRLAFLALNRDYGFSKIPCYSPQVCSELEIDPQDPSVLMLSLSNCPNGLSRYNEIEGLEICGQDGIFLPVNKVQYKWETRKLKISHPAIKNPVELRYAWGDYRPGNIKNAEGLPLFPFRLKLSVEVQ